MLSAFKKGDDFVSVYENLSEADKNRLILKRKQSGIFGIKSHLNGKTFKEILCH